MATETSSGRTGRRRSWWAAVAGAVVVVLLAGVIGGLIVEATESTPQANACPATKVANETLPSVVTITASSGSSGGTGSGEVIRSDGYILTNNHVISVAANGGSVEVLFSDGRSAPATITGRDPRADLAVLKVNGQPPLPVIPTGKSKDVVVGQPVVALGAPLGLSDTVTSGIVSALNRTVDVPGDNGQTALLVSAVQTDAAINPGNSGGALTDCSGKMIGVPTAGASAPTENGGASSGNIGLGFAIPVDQAIAVSNEIIATGTVSHAWFGIQAVAIPPAAAERAGVSQGLYVQAVVPGGPSAQAGLQSGDVITEINGAPARSTDQLAALAITQRAGATVKVKYERNGQEQSTTITLASQP